MMLVVPCAAALWCAVSGAVAVAGTWHRAIEVPGTGALNKGGRADV
jgi:hypothetical protein